jgi:hypothetical protein
VYLVHLETRRRSEAWKSFFFDRVWKADANQAEVFADIEPMVISVLGKLALMPPLALDMPVI